MYKTVGGYARAIKRINRQSLSDLKGYEELSEKKREAIEILMAEIDNCLAEFFDEE